MCFFQMAAGLFFFSLLICVSGGLLTEAAVSLQHAELLYMLHVEEEEAGSFRWSAPFTCLLEIS